MITINKSILGIIPARHKSKRLLNKNLKLFNKKPLIHWTIKASQKSKLISKTLVTTDSLKILKKAKDLKVDYCLKRPKKLSTSKADTWSVVKHAVNYLKKKNLYYDYVVVLQPTSPLRNANHIDRCLKKLKKNHTGIISISKTLKPIEWQVNLGKRKNFNFFKKGILKYRRKKRINNSYIINGAIYAFKTKEIFEKNFIFKNSVTTFIMDHKYSIDIDNLLEFQIAEFIRTKYKS